jgi:predicted dehydrogenase
MTKGRDSAKPRLGFLGLGWIGLQRMAAIASSEEAEIVALADPVTDLVAKAAELAPESCRPHPQGADLPG